MNDIRFSVQNFGKGPEVADPQKATGWRSNGVSIVIPSALVSSIAASGMVLFLGSTSITDMDPKAIQKITRPDPYTGEMHRLYAETMDAKLDASVARDLHLTSVIEANERTCERRISEINRTILRLHQESEYRGRVLEAMQKILTELTEAPHK